MNQTTYRSRLAALTAFSLAASAMLAACGGGDAEAPPLAAVAAPPPAAAPTPAPPAPAPAPTPPPAPPPAPAPSGTVLVSFDETAPAFTGMGAYGGALPTVETGPTGGSGLALKILKPVSPDTWGGTFFTVARVPFAADRKAITAQVYSTRAGALIKLKVEIAGGASVEVVGTATGAANTWGTVTWDLAAVDITKNYTVMAITPDADLVTSGQAYFIDDIKLAAAVAAAPPPAPGATFVSFDETVPAFSAMGAYGGALPTVEASPLGGSGSALKILKPVSPDTWGGVFFTTTTIPFAPTTKAITARVYSSRAGAVIKFKVEVPGGTSVEVASAPTGAANTWSTVTWDFSAVNLANSYKIIAITPDADLVTTGQTYWIDDIKIAAGVAAPPPPTSAPVDIATLEEPGASVTGFEGAYDATVVAESAILAENAGCGSSSANKIVRWVKPASNVANFAGFFIVTVANGGLPPIPFTATARSMTVRVWSPDAGIPVRLKVENNANGNQSAETEAVTTVAGGWQTLTFNFANPSTGTPALDLTGTYDKVSIFFDFGTAGTAKTYYFDDVTFVTGTGTNTVLVTFDEAKARVLSGFGGAEDATIVGQSQAQGNPNGKAAKVVKAAGSQVWAGTTVVAKLNDAVPTIPFTAGATKMSLRTCTAAPVGTRVRLKVEKAGVPEINSEVDAFTTVANAWETLTFDLGPLGLHFIPNGPGPTGYQTNPNLPGYLPTAQLEPGGVRTFNKVNIFFDYGLGDGGYAAMPDRRVYYADQVKFIGP